MFFYQNENSKNPYNYNKRETENYFFPPHFHNDFELAYVKAGCCTVTIDGNSQEIKENEFSLILPNSIHSYQTKESSIVTVFVFSKEYVSEFYKKIHNKRSTANCFFMSESEKNVFFSHLISENPEVLDIVIAMNIACSAFLKAKSNGIFTVNKSPTDSLMQKILYYITFHYTENISLKTLASETGYEEHYLSRCFHRYFNKNFKQFINEMRISKAMEYMLANPNASIIDVAFSSGFQSVRNFNRIYKNITGTTPTENKRFSE